MRVASSARRDRRLTGALVLAGWLAAGCLETALAAPPPDNGAAIVMYHRFGENEYASTNIRLEQFEAHIAELTSGPYAVLALGEIVAALVEGRSLPERAVAITIDDAYRSVYTEAWPRLRAAALPFTVFVATGPLDDGLPGYMTWDELREMVASGGVTLGNHGVAHRHMAEDAPGKARAELARAAARFEQELGAAPNLFAYPYGEYSLALRNVVAEAGFAAAFGQHSGAVARTGDLFALPRYPLNERYGDLDRFRLVVNSLPLPVTEVTPADPLVRPAHNPPLYGFTVVEGVSGLEALGCFASNNEITVERLGEWRIETRLSAPFPPGRARVNCTMPGPDGRWRWHGIQFYVTP